MSSLAEIASAKDTPKGRRGTKPVYTENDIANFEELRKTMTWDQMEVQTGVHKHFIRRLIAERGEPQAHAWRPRVIREATFNFTPDNIDVRD